MCTMTTTTTMLLSRVPDVTEPLRATTQPAHAHSAPRRIRADTRGGSTFANFSNLLRDPRYFYGNGDSAARYVTREQILRSTYIHTCIIYIFVSGRFQAISGGRVLTPHRYAATELQFKAEISRDDIVHKQPSAVYCVFLFASLYGEENCANYIVLAHFSFEIKTNVETFFLRLIEKKKFTLNTWIFDRYRIENFYRSAICYALVSLRARDYSFDGIQFLTSH